MKKMLSVPELKIVVFVITVAFICLSGNVFAGEKNLTGAKTVGISPLNEYADSLSNAVLESKASGQEPFIHELPANMTKQMKESLANYVRAFLIDALGGNGSASGGKKGMCLPKGGGKPTCTKDDILLTDTLLSCFGQPEELCSRGGRMDCVNKYTNRVRTFKYSCEWLSLEK